MDQKTTLMKIIIGYVESQQGTFVAKQLSDFVFGEEEAADKTAFAMATSTELLTELRGRLDPEGEMVAAIDDMLGYLEPLPSSIASAFR